MSNFDNFEIDQMSSKFAWKSFFVPYSHYKKITILGSLDNAKNVKRQLFLDTLYPLWIDSVLSSVFLVDQAHSVLVCCDGLIILCVNPGLSNGLVCFQWYWQSSHNS